MITVKKLIEMLQDQPEDAIVMAEQAHENGFTTVTGVEFVGRCTDIITDKSYSSVVTLYVMED